MSKLWSEKDFQTCIEILHKAASYQTALACIQRRVSGSITADSLRSAFCRAGYNTPSAYLGMEHTPGTPGVEDPDIQKLVGCVQKRKSLTLHDLCDLLDVSPKKAQSIIGKAQGLGYTIDIAHGVVGNRPPEKTTEVDIKPAEFKAGAAMKIGVIADPHFGSKYCLSTQMECFIREAYKEGVRDFFSPGDILEGCYKHAQWELSQSDWESQAQDFLKHLPQMPGLRFHWVDGNHDWTWTERNGYESGKALVTLAKGCGRHDLFYYGARGALLNYGGTRIELWHPKKGMGYSLSYQLQNHIRDTNPQRQPDLLFAGHWHRYVKLRQQNVWAFACPTFQHGDTPHGHSLGGDVAIGGLIVSWRKDSDGVVRKLSDEYRVIDYEIPEFST